MNNKYKTLVVINPNSSNGSTSQKLNEINSLLSKNISDYDLKLTESKGHATYLVREGLKNDFNRIIGIGGDGTYNEVTNGFFENESPINENAVLGFISGGTGADFIKSAKIPKGYSEAIDIILKNNIKKIDAGMVKFTLEDKTTKTRYFINIADVGIGGAVVDRVNKTTKVFGGFASFLMGTIQTVFEYENQYTKITFDDDFTIEKVTNNIVVGNGKFFGGGMKILPDAELDDGYFDVLTIGDISKIEFFKNVSKIYSGTHLNNPKLEVRKAKKVYVESKVPLKLDIDGEQEGFSPVEFTILPKSMNIIVP